MASRPTSQLALPGLGETLDEPALEVLVDRIAAGFWQAKLNVPDAFGLGSGPGTALDALAPAAVDEARRILREERPGLRHVAWLVLARHEAGTLHAILGRSARLAGDPPPRRP